MLWPLTVWITTNCGKFLETGIPDHLTYRRRNLHTGQEAIVRTGHGTTNWFKNGKGVRQGCTLLPCLLNLEAEHIMWNAGWITKWIKIAGRNINNLRYADSTTSMAESEDELKGLLMRVKEEAEKAGLKLNIQKLRSWQIMGKQWKQWQILFGGGSKITADGDNSHKIKRN